MDDLLTDIDTVVAIHLLNLINGNDIGAMDTQETVFGQHVLYGFHRQMGDQRLGLVVKIEQHIVLHAIDIGNLVDGYVSPFAVDADEDSFWWKVEGGGRSEITFIPRFCQRTILAHPDFSVADHQP